MSSKLARRTLLIALGALLAAVLVAGPGSAQQGPTNPTFTVTKSTPPANPIVVNVGQGQITLDWTYAYPNQALIGTNPVTSIATLTWKTPTCDKGGIVITGPLTQTIVLSPQDSNKPGSSSFTVQATEEAPGELTIKCRFEGTVSSPSLGTTQPSPIEVPIRVAYRGLLTVNVPLTIAQAGPQKQINYNIELTNLGNAQSSLTFNLIGDTEAGWKPITPPSNAITLQSDKQGGTQTTQTVTFQVSTPYKNGWNNKETTFQLVIQPQSTNDLTDTGKGPPITVNVLARVRGIYVPGPEIGLVAIGMVGVAMVVARHLRKDE